jgi:hypothetical protein
MTDIAKSIIALDPTAQFSVNADDINQITWYDSNPNNITDAQILAKQIELQVAYDAQEYARKRLAEYPSIEECVHAMLDDGLAELQEKRAAVKAKYPKGG